MGLMAKCGCSGQACSCSLTAGAGISITGTGAADNPFVLTARQVFLAVTDTATIDLTLTGTGTQTNPYTLSGAFIGTIPTPDWTAAESRTWAAGTVSLTDVTTPRTIRVAITGNVTSVTLPTWTSSNSGSITLIIAQDATGSRTWVTPGTKAGGTPITLTTAANARDVIRLFWTGVQWVTTAVAMNVS